MLFTFGLCIQGKYHLHTYVDSQEKEHKVRIDHLQSGGMPVASLYKSLTPKVHASPIPGHGEEVAVVITNYIMHCHVVACGTLT